MMLNRLLSVFLALAAVACVVDGVAAQSGYEYLDEGPYCDIPGWCGDGTKAGCESQAFDLTPKETIEILKNAVPLPGGSVEKTTKSTSIKTSVYTGEVVVGNPAARSFGTTTTTCSSSCTGNGCSITGCDASWSGCDSCSCFGSSCSACTCTKTSTYTESLAAPGGGTNGDSRVGPPVRRGV